MNNSKSDGPLDSGDDSGANIDRADTGPNVVPPEGNGGARATESVSADQVDVEAAAPVLVTDAATVDSAATAGAPPAAANIPYGAPGAATTAPGATSTVVPRAVALVRGVPVDRYIAAAVGAAVVYASTWLLALVFTLLAFVAAADADLDWGLAFAAPAQIVGLAVAGSFTVGATVMGVSASVTMLWLPLLVTAFLIFATAFVARRNERSAPSASTGIRWLLSGLTGLVLALLVLIVAAVTPLRYAVGDGSDTGFGVVSGTGTASSASVTAFLGALVVGTLVSYLARARVASRAAGVTATVIPRAATSVLAAVRSTVPVVGMHLGVLAVFLAVGLLIWAVVEGGIDTLLTAFFWLPTLVVDGLGLVNLAPVTLGGGLGALAGLAGSASSFWMPSTLPAWGTVLVLIVNLVLIIGTGIVLRLRRAQLSLSAAMSWLTTILTFAVAGVAISLLGGIAVWTSIDTSGMGDMGGLLGGIGSMIESAAAASGTIGLAAWTFIVFAALGALVETVAVFAAPTLVQLLPSAVLARAGRLTALVGVPFAMPGAVVAPTTPVGATQGGATPAMPVGAMPVGAMPAGSTSADAAAPVAAAVAPMSPEKKRRVKIVVASAGGALVLVLGAAIAISIVNQVVFSPEHQVESYLDAVVAKDASGALALGDIKATDEERALLTDAVLTATDGGISGYTVTDVSNSDDSATVTVDVEQGDSTDETTYTLQKSGTTGLFFDEWKLDRVYLPALPISISSDITELDVNGVAIKLTAEEQEAGYLQYYAFAGEYVISSGGDNEWLTAKPQTVQVGVLETSDTVQLALEPTKEFTTSIDKQVADYLADCVAQKSLNADDCPIYTYDYGTITDVVWTIDEPAVTTLDSSYDGEWYVSTDDRGSATVTYTNTDYSGAVTQETDTVAFSINGTVTLEDDAPVFTDGY